MPVSIVLNVISSHIFMCFMGLICFEKASQLDSYNALLFSVTADHDKCSCLCVMYAVDLHTVLSYKPFNVCSEIIMSSFTPTFCSFLQSRLHEQLCVIHLLSSALSSRVNLEATLIDTIWFSNMLSYM
jgi:hypothetical protein